ncbi:MAG: PIG-L family deacetylase [Actinobacteria bacterium]|nr:PIG-L family deacetylase [Actinomycetota bacterium]
MAEQSGVRRILCAYAHPDDVEFSFGGTVAAWTSQGIEVHYVCVTDGSAGNNEPGWTRESIAEVRQREQREAASILGVADVTFLGYPDGYLEVTLALRRDLTREVRRFRPDRVVTLDPSALWVARRYVNHPDHRAVGEAMLAVINPDAPSRPQFPELLDEGHEPFEVPELWLPSWDPGESDEVIDITASIDKKISALHAHASQLKNMGVDDIEPQVRERASAIAKGREFEYGEAFKVFHLRDEDDQDEGAAADDASRDAGSAGFEES